LASRSGCTKSEPESQFSAESHKALVRANHWLDKLDAGQANSTFELADQESCHVRYVRNVLKLAFLAPDITEAILDGRQPALLTLADLIRAELPASWPAQRALLGFSPRP